ncbi:adenosine receptor A2b-like [Glandiceps talaboti]
MAVADLLVGTVNIPCYIAEKVGLMAAYNYQCVFVRCVTTFFILASVAHLLVIAIDRYVAIAYPLRYQILMTRRKAFTMLGLAWILSLMAAFLPLMGWRRSSFSDLTDHLADGCGFDKLMTLSYVLVMGIVFFATPVSVMLALYCWIFAQTRKQLRKIGALNETFVVSRNSNRKRKQELRAARVLCVIMGCYLLCMTPAVISLLLDQTLEDGVPSLLTQFVFVVTFLNSALNPAIYSLGNRQVRHAIGKRLFSKIYKSRVEWTANESPVVVS